MYIQYKDKKDPHFICICCTPTQSTYTCILTMSFSMGVTAGVLNKQANEQKFLLKKQNNFQLNTYSVSLCVLDHANPPDFNRLINKYA